MAANTALGAAMGPIEIDDYILDLQLVKNFQLERSTKVTVSTLLIGLSALRELSNETGVPIDELDRKHVFKYHADIDLTDADIEIAKVQADKILNSGLSPSNGST